MAVKLKNAYFKIKSYWRKPPRGYDVSYKEFVNLAIGFGGISFGSIVIQWTTLAMSVHMMISYFKVSSGLVWILGILGSVIALLRSPIQSMIIDNSNSAKGKFKPFLMWTNVGAMISCGLIPFIPNAWNSIELFRFGLPAIPIMGVTDASVLHVSLAVVVMFIMLQAGMFFNTLLNQAMAGVEQTISTVAQERANIGSLKGLICNIPSSLVNILLPILAGSALFAPTGGWNSIFMYRWVFPFCAVGSAVCMLFIIKGTKERVVVNKKYVAKVKFLQGAKDLTRNKYFWIITIFNTAMTIRILCNLNNWITQYSFESNTAKTIVGIYCTTLLMNVLVLGMVFGPVLIRKFGKKKVLSFANVGFTLMVALQFICYKQPVMILFAALLQNCFGGLAFVAAIMVSDVMDYLQYKTGRRLEGFWQNYSAFVATIIGIFTGMLLPLFLSFGGIGFGDDISEALKDVDLRNGAFKYQSLLALIGSVIAMVPMFFYDLTEKRHADIVRALKLRAAADNYEDGVLQEIDVINVKEIMDYAADKQIEFVSEEMGKHDFWAKITENYQAVKSAVEKHHRDEDMKNFLRDIDLEERRVNMKLKAARDKALNKKIDFDESAYLLTLKKKERFLRYFVSGELAVYKTVEQIAAVQEEVYLKLEKIWADEKAARKAEKLLKQEKNLEKA